VSHAIPYIDGAAVHAALEWGPLIDALRDAFRAGAEAPVRASHAVNAAGDRLLLMPAWTSARIGVKLVTVFPRNLARGIASVAALYVLLDAATGHPLALIDGEALTLRRTAAASALASIYLSRPDSRRLLVVGAGALAPYMAAAHRAVRPIEAIAIWGRTPAHVERTVATLRAGGVEATAAADLARAAGEADIVTCATTARSPVLSGAWIRPGTHVDLVGAFTPEMRESDDALVAAARLYVDTFAGALGEAGDLVQAMASGAISRAAVRAELADLVTGRDAGRIRPDEITLFKSVGTALEDLAAADLVWARRAAA
jgi:ornithine cyclodeaminase